MRIADQYKPGKTVISFEIFPPKKEIGAQSLYYALDELCALKPGFISVTCGAGGSAGGAGATAEIAEHIIKECGTEALAHVTCADMSAGEVETVAADLKRRGIENVLALRGDGGEVKSKKEKVKSADEAEGPGLRGQGSGNKDVFFGGGFRYAKDLIVALKKHGFCLGAAGYPEGHISCDSEIDDIAHLKQKQDAGADFFITQLFFSNDIFYRFLDRARAAGVTRPICAGVMPILSKSQIERMIFMCGASLPSPIIKMINRYGDEGDSLVKAGLEYSCAQMQGLYAYGVDGIHIYTMNKPFIAKYCVERL
ncbi:MAG: methylenetetrahydrofolate reductase [Firmicutes bacterium]|nr:methylenetetrahydrofolate reductase [Bacillota bacterium]